MNILSTVLIVLALLASVALILVVVVQKSKGGGLASGFASANNIMGVRQSTDLLEKLTWGFFGTLAVLCIVISLLMTRGIGSENSLQNAIEQKATQQPATPTIPAFGGEVAPTTPATAPAEQPTAPSQEQTPAPEAPAQPN